ncbi:hypothetical protein CALVIDRAFT_539817 [Calocera viscosa TUFC12733]|uniref:Uncharacterized protein n=1 Tax=Calocera viscosa (strain TUFC12733) TaxID=1330018 RepID=A0A167JIY2_CALVF|nr:hypothetical protein CALVIDRAFT_539817 [Calocera viscosa TUFC12733]
MAIWFTIVMHSSDLRTVAIVYCASPAASIKACFWILSLVARHSQMALPPSTPENSDESVAVVVVKYGEAIFMVLRMIVVGLAYTSVGCDLLMGLSIFLVLLIKVISPVSAWYRGWNQGQVTQRTSLDTAEGRYACLPTEQIELPDIV